MRYETKIRLRGINCAEKGTKKGDAAKKFVEDELGWIRRMENGEGNMEGQKVSGSSVLHDPFSVIVIKTYKSGKFGRFIADVWYLKGETDQEKILKKGKLLNQVLLDKGLAQKVE